jgi:hypothetical protein
VQAYLDESGTSGRAKAIAVGGFVSTTQGWRDFSIAWSKELALAGVSHCHATDLECFQGEFEDWDPARRTAFRQRLGGVLKRYTKYGVSSGVIYRDYEKLVPESNDMRRKAGSPYSMSVNACVSVTLRWARARGLSDPIDFLFEDGGPSKGEIIDWWQRLKRAEPLVGELSFHKKMSLLPLQAADYHAYEAWKQLENRFVNGPKRDIRKSLEALLGGGPIEGTYYDADSIRRYLELVKDATVY